MKVKTKYCIGKEYFTLDAETLNHLEMKECDVEEAITKARLQNFDASLTIITMIEGRLAQYTIVSKNVGISKSAIVLEDVYVYYSKEDLCKAANSVIGFHEFSLFDSARKEGVCYDFPVNVGISKGDNIIAGYLIRERLGEKTMVNTVLFSREKYQDFLEEVAYVDDKFAVFKNYFLERQ